MSDILSDEFDVGSSVVKGQKVFTNVFVGETSTGEEKKVLERRILSRDDLVSGSGVSVREDVLEHFGKYMRMDDVVGGVVESLGVELKPEQLLFWDSIVRGGLEESKLNIVLVSRQMGKSFSCRMLLVMHALFPLDCRYSDKLDHELVFISETIQKSKRSVSGIRKLVSNFFGGGFDGHYDDSGNLLVVPNCWGGKSYITFAGYPRDTDRGEALRGMSPFFVVLDEAQSVPPKLIDDVLLPYHNNSLIYGQTGLGFYMPQILVMGTAPLRTEIADSYKAIEEEYKANGHKNGVSLKRYNIYKCLDSRKRYVRGLEELEGVEGTKKFEEMSRLKESIVSMERDIGRLQAEGSDAYRTEYALEFISSDLDAPLLTHIQRCRDALKNCMDMKAELDYGLPVYCTIDIGQVETVIWFFQIQEMMMEMEDDFINSGRRMMKKYVFIDYKRYKKFNYADITMHLATLQEDRGFFYGGIVIPHDARRGSQLIEGKRTIREYLLDNGWAGFDVERRKAIDFLQDTTLLLKDSLFDEKYCIEGVRQLLSVRPSKRAHDKLLQNDTLHTLDAISLIGRVHFNFFNMIPNCKFPAKTRYDDVDYYLHDEMKNETKRMLKDRYNVATIVTENEQCSLKYLVSKESRHGKWWMGSF